MYFPFVLSPSFSLSLHSLVYNYSYLWLDVVAFNFFIVTGSLVWLGLVGSGAFYFYIFTVIVNLIHALSFNFIIS